MSSCLPSDATQNATVRAGLRTSCSALGYRKELPLADALRRPRKAGGTQFDPAVIRSSVSSGESEVPAVMEAMGMTESSTF